MRNVRNLTLMTYALVNRIQLQILFSEAQRPAHEMYVGRLRGRGK